MRVLSFIPALLLVGSTALSAWAADLTKIDDTITKEPAYQGTPMYCLLVFGLEAQTRVWLVLDGRVLPGDWPRVRAVLRRRVPQPPWLPAPGRRS
jgi:hypothetical protein